MSVPLLEAIADAITAREGWFPDTRSYRNRNPGNLRDSVWPHETDTGGYCIFKSFVSGYCALMDDLTAKVTGKTKTGLSVDSSLLKFFEVYAPAQDNNSPTVYASFVVMRLMQVYNVNVTYYMTFRELYTSVAKQELPGGVAAA